MLSKLIRYENSRLNNNNDNFNENNRYKDRKVSINIKNGICALIKKDCGAACLATISKQYGFKIPISKIREVAGTDKQGTSAFGIIKAAEQLGFSAKGVRSSKPEDIFTEFSLPCIAHVVIDGSFLHYVVIRRLTEKEILIFTILGVLVDEILQYNLLTTLHILSIGFIVLNIFKILLNAFNLYYEWTSLGTYPSKYSTSIIDAYIY